MQYKNLKIQKDYHFRTKEIKANEASWKWQTPQLPYTNNYEPSAPPCIENDSEHLDGERPTSVQSNCITKTTAYDPQTGGFITSVSTDTSDHALPVLQCSPVDKLILSQNSYNTLSRKMSTSDSYATLPRPELLITTDQLKRTDSSGNVSGNLINQSPQYVTSIAVVSRCGSLLTLSSSADVSSGDVSSDISDTEESDDGDNVEAINDMIMKVNNHYLTSVNNQFVANIQLGSLSLDRLNSKSYKTFTRQPLDSLVTSSLLDLTKPRQEEYEDKIKLSAYILDEEEENSFDNQRFDKKPKVSTTDDDLEENHLSATILDRGEEGNNLYHTISRKKILSQVKCPNFHLHNNGQIMGPIRDESANDKSEPNNLNLNERPLAKILERLHSVRAQENTYVSLTGESLYQSLQNQNVKPDDNNNEDKAPHEVMNACPVLVANILATHAETLRHAEMTGCVDCLDYVDSLDKIIPYLRQGEGTTCQIHNNVRITILFLIILLKDN